MKLSDMKTGRQVRDEDYRDDPEYRAEWDRTAFAREVALAVLNYRTDNGLSQRDLATRTGLTQPAIARLEAGETPPRLETLVRLTCGTGLRLRLDVAGGTATLASEPPKGTPHRRANPGSMSGGAAGVPSRGRQTAAA